MGVGDDYRTKHQLNSKWREPKGLWPNGIKVLKMCSSPKGFEDSSLVVDKMNSLGVGFNGCMLAIQKKKN